jgi:HPt (histidine-containing phosphotransfer) domain-containing protein
VVDRAVLDELTGGDAELADAILADYVESSSSDLAALRAALADESSDHVRRHAHRIKGAGGTVGAREVTTLAATLEAVASTAVEDWPGLRATAEELERAIARVAAAVNGPPVMR